MSIAAKNLQLPHRDDKRKKVAVVESQNVAFTNMEFVFGFMHCPPEKTVATRSDLRKPAVVALPWTPLS
jgi:hypothetical protein